MRLKTIVIEDFFADPDYHRTHCLPEDFRTHLAEDGVGYPGINPLVNAKTYHEVMGGLNLIFSGEGSVIPHKMFWRLTSSAQPPAPNYIHSDYGFAQYAAHFYMFKNSDAVEGRTGIDFYRSDIDGSERFDPAQSEQLKAELMAASNDLGEWECSMRVETSYNQCVIHDAHLWHSAEPQGGFGTGYEDGRLVLTCFFSVTK